MGKYSKLWYLEHLDLFTELPEQALNELNSITVMHQCFKKEVIYFEETYPDTIFFCKEGRIKISRTDESGRETTLYIVQPGQIFGEQALVGEDKRTHRAEALDRNVMICSIPRAEFEAFLQRYPELSRKVYKSIGERMRTVEQKLADIIFRGSEERIINFLYTMGKENQKPGGVDEAYIRPFFTHEEIAYLTATSRQTVTSVLNKLKSEDVLTYNYNKMYIKQLSWLEDRTSLER